LQNNGHEVHIIDLQQKVEKTILNTHGLTVHIGDVSSYNIFEHLENMKFDGAFHLAAQTSARISEEQPDIDIDSNVKGVLNFCNWVRKSKPRRVVFTSSMAVYGYKGDYISENTPLNPVSVYGVTKYAGELFFRILREEGVNVTIYRLFNVYGPGQDFYNLKQGMLSIFLSQALTGEIIEVTGSLNRYRDFIYIDDVVNALLIEPPASEDFIFNVGSGKPVYVRDLLNTIINRVALIKSGVQIKEIEGHRGDVFGNYADNRLLRSHGWHPLIELEEGIDRTIPNAMEVLKCK
jgi:UDP-glucose 4-epimerase